MHNVEHNVILLYLKSLKDKGYNYDNFNSF